MTDSKFHSRASLCVGPNRSDEVDGPICFRKSVDLLVKPIVGRGVWLGSTIQ